MEGPSGPAEEGELPLLTVKHELRNANLTGHAEKVGIENFELLKVLGTGVFQLCLRRDKYRWFLSMWPNNPAYLLNNSPLMKTKNN